MEELADDLLPQRSLVCAIIAQAVRDCSKGDTREGREAIRWLQARETLEWGEAWGIDLERIKKIVDSNTIKRPKMA